MGEGRRGFSVDSGQLTVDSHWVTDVPVFEIRWVKNPPPSETVGAENLPPATFRI